jgi:hypothetical protein
MAYTFFFLLGIPLWLIASAKLLGSDVNPPKVKWAWAALAFLTPILVFGMGAVAHVILQQRFGDEAAWLRGFGYFIVVLNLFAFFSSFAVQFIFEARYGAKRRSTIGQ